MRASSLSLNLRPPLNDTLYLSYSLLGMTPVWLCAVRPRRKSFLSSPPDTATLLI